MPAESVRENPKEVLTKLWLRHLHRAEAYDKELAETWKADADGVLIFTGLFSTMVAAFIIESYKLLQPDSGDTTVFLLTQISQQLSNPNTSSSLPPSLPSSRRRRLEFWARKYVQAAHPGNHSDPYTRARLRAFIFEGVVNSHISKTLELVPAILHVSVFLFLAGMVEFLFPNSHTVAYVVVACPISDPLSPVLWRLTLIPVMIPYNVRWICHLLQCRVIMREPNWSLWPALELDEDRMSPALCWEFDALETDQEYEDFFDAVHAVADTCGAASALHGLVKDRVRELSDALLQLFDTCKQGGELPASVASQRAAVCLRATWDLALASPIQQHGALRVLIPNLEPLLSKAPTWIPIFCQSTNVDPRIATTARLAQALMNPLYGYAHTFHWTISPLNEDIRAEMRSTIFELLDVPPALREFANQPGDLRTNVHIILVCGVVTDLLPHLRGSYADGVAHLVADFVAFDTLGLELSWGRPWAQAASPVQRALVDVYKQVSQIADVRNQGSQGLPQPLPESTTPQSIRNVYHRTLGRGFTQLLDALAYITDDFGVPMRELGGERRAIGNVRGSNGGTLEPSRRPDTTGAGMQSPGDNGQVRHTADP
ncbi:hypothetical protein BC834DRAFT_974550 [Gloeopeniophorella convolvens]|nr:hypothetical protein BC834DRAFT_974550 [Gloeopeniophorella convolvens]